MFIVLNDEGIVFYKAFSDGGLLLAIRNEPFVKGNTLFIVINKPVTCCNALKEVYGLLKGVYGSLKEVNGLLLRVTRMLNKAANRLKAGTDR